MRRLIVCNILLAVCSVSVMAQDYHIRVVLKDGQEITWPVSEVEFIDFPAKDELTAKYELSLISNEVVWDSNNHSAFTCLTEWGGEKLLAFREGAAHRPTSTSDYGHITILHESEGKWEKTEDLSHQDMDLRDPFFVVINGCLRLYCGYNQFIDGKYQHSGTAYSDLTNAGWSEFIPIQHDVPHITWLWKIRKYKETYYGVGYLEGEKPVLLNSHDGISWTTLTEFDIEGVLTEADLCFLNDTMFVCMRQDTPRGTPSHWGVAKYPFDDFRWSRMKISIHCPDLICLPESNQIFLAGREFTEETISVSVFECDLEGNADKKCDLQLNPSGDMGYPSFLRQRNDVIYLSYYFGSGNTTIAEACFHLTTNK